MKIFDSYLTSTVFILALVLLPVGTQAVTINGTSFQVTTSPNNQYSPAIDEDIVVYSSTSMATGETDVFFTDISTMVETQITISPGAQELVDISDGTIVFRDSPLLGGSLIYAYDIASASLSPITSPNGTEDAPTISGDIIAFVSRGASADIYAYDLSAAASIIIANTADDELLPRIDGTRVVYERSTASGWHVVVHDIVTNAQTTIASGLTAEPTPDISATTVAYVVESGAGDTDIAIHDLASASTTVITAAGNQARPRLNGDMLAFDNIDVSESDVILRHLPSGVEQVIPGAGTFEFLNDITAGRVAYSSNAGGAFDIWVYEFTVQPDQLTELTSPAECGPETVSINFDDQPTGVLDSNAYANQGVSFLDDQWSTPLVLGPAQRGTTTSSEPNSLSNDADTLSPGSAGIPLTISFDAPVLCAGMYIGNGSNAGIDVELVAYDQNGSVIGSAFDPVPDPTTEFFGVASAIPISVITLDYGNTTLAEEIDDLSFVSAVNIDVAPHTVAFGDVGIGASTTAIVTLSNTGVADLRLNNLTLGLANSDMFVSSAPSLPATIPANGTVDVEMTFAPLTTGSHTNVLQIFSNDPDEYLVEVSLSGTGIVSDSPPIEQIKDLLEFFDVSVASGTLWGNGNGNSAQGRLGALRNMLEATADLINQGELDDACKQLRDIYLRTDGNSRPPDFVTGTAAATLADKVLELMESLGCS